MTTDARQRIDGWGASVVTDSFVDPLADPRTPARQLTEMDLIVFRLGGINLVRVFGQGYTKAKPTAAQPARTDDGRFAFMRRVARYGVRFMYTGAAAPANLRDGKFLRPGAEAAYATYIAGYLRYARDVANAPFAFSAIGNEPDNKGSLLVMTPQQTSAVYAALARQLAAQRLDTRLVLGDTTGWGTACPYAERQLAAPGVPQSAAAFATHPYYGTVTEARSLRHLVARRGLALWQTEFGTGCVNCKDDDSQHQAIRWARKIASALVDAQTTAWFAFRPVADVTHGPGDGLLVRTHDARRPFYVSRRFDVFRQFSSVAPPGSRRLVVRGTGRQVQAVAFRSKRGVALVVVNPATTPWRTTLTFPARGRLRLTRTSGTERFARLPVRRYSGKALPVTLPPESVSTYVLGR